MSLHGGESLYVKDAFPDQFDFYIRKSRTQLPTEPNLSSSETYNRRLDTLITNAHHLVEQETNQQSTYIFFPSSSPSPGR